MLQTILAVAAVAISLAAFGTSLWSLKYQRELAHAATRQANAAETAYAKLVIAEAATEGTPVPKPATPDVRWEIGRPAKNRFILRNSGSDVATGVTVDESRIDAIPRDLPRDMAIRTGASAEFTLMGEWGVSHPNEIWVSWDGHEEPVAVPAWRGRQGSGYGLADADPAVGDDRQHRFLVRYGGRPSLGRLQHLLLRQGQPSVCAN